MRNRHNPCGPRVEAFVGLHTRGGELIPAEATLAAARARGGTGRYTHADGRVQEEPCAHVESVTREAVLTFLRASDQESALIGDDWGRWFLLYDDGREERLPGALTITTEQPDGDHCQLGELFYQVGS